MLTCLKVLLTLATESVITQSSGTAGALMHASVLLASKRAKKAFSSSGRRVTGQLVFGFPFVVRNISPAHPTSFIAGVVRFNHSPVLMLCLFDGFSEGIAGFLISVRISVPLLESGSSSL
jgi:hypothetical protein